MLNGADNVLGKVIAQSGWLVVKNQPSLSVVPGVLEFPALKWVMTKKCHEYLWSAVHHLE